MKAVFLGRFSPLHLGHQMVNNQMITEYGSDNALILIGSSNVINERTPFSFEFRQKLISLVYPDITTLPLPDVNSDDVWLENLKNLEKQTNGPFEFVGGSNTDISLLSTKFKTRVIVDRLVEGQEISATKVRYFLKMGNYEEVKKLLHPKVFKALISSYKQWAPLLHK